MLKPPADPATFPLPPRRFAVGGVPCTLEDLLLANPDLDVGDLHDVASLEIGESVTYGGGEFQSITITRTE